MDKLEWVKFKRNYFLKIRDFEELTNRLGKDNYSWLLYQPSQLAFNQKMPILGEGRVSPYRGN